MLFSVGGWGWRITKPFEDWDAKGGSHFIFFTDDLSHRLQAVERNSVADRGPRPPQPAPRGEIPATHEPGADHAVRCCRCREPENAVMFLPAQKMQAALFRPISAPRSCPTALETSLHRGLTAFPFRSSLHHRPSNGESAAASWARRRRPYSRTALLRSVCRWVGSSAAATAVLPSRLSTRWLACKVIWKSNLNVSVPFPAVFVIGHPVAARFFFVHTF